ncbi:Succinylglutamate desuccinylase/aspartoacylase [Gemmatirosa kalamazoonensis]|uniref:Succinylglutamate desuccinylase/aspartoacylase n=1 Tax=Gemmatirosa kalamazoonensis TaxID=861299 RepID=W0RDH3_9BACT|nr:succinylglutamate desuccinylase/aspartoacylase family protein [Gemmatirosa kalamazoonensis]AHG89159.1 Succinylglutamate desuccinylase/aspartoacylase [Gemmatirosa kalamazoonensis]
MLRLLSTAALVALAASTAAAQDTFTVGTATAARGAIAYGTLVVPPGPDSGLRIPVVVVHGAHPGRVVAFVAGSHGTEYTSIVAMQRLAPRIDAARLAGTVVVVPLINVASIEGMTPHLNPVDRKSMNGNYPGDTAGTQTQRALAAVARAVVDPADVVVDLHGGDLDEDLRPYSYWFRGGNAAQDSAGRALALAFGLDHVIVTDVDPASPTAGRSLSGYALTKGKTVLVAEAGRSGVVAPADLAALVDGSLNVLGALGMLPRAVRPVAHPVWLGGNASARLAADSGGMFFAAVARDTRVRKGDVVGRTTDYHGRPTGEVRAPIDGVVTFVRGVPSMWPRATLVNVAPVLASPAPWARPTP